MGALLTGCQFARLATELALEADLLAHVAGGALDAGKPAVHDDPERAHVHGGETAVPTPEDEGRLRDLGRIRRPGWPIAPRPPAS